MAPRAGQGRAPRPGGIARRGEVGRRWPACPIAGRHRPVRSGGAGPTGMRGSMNRGTAIGVDPAGPGGPTDPASQTGPMARRPKGDSDNPPDCHRGGGSPAMRFGLVRTAGWQSPARRRPCGRSLNAPRGPLSSQHIVARAGPTGVRSLLQQADDPGDSLPPFAIDPTPLCTRLAAPFSARVVYHVAVVTPSWRWCVRLARR